MLTHTHCADPATTKNVTDFGFQGNGAAVLLLLWPLVSSTTQAQKSTLVLEQNQ